VLGGTGRDLKQLLTTKEGATKAIRMILDTGILGQFKGVAGGEDTRSRRDAGDGGNELRP